MPVNSEELINLTQSPNQLEYPNEMNKIIPSCFLNNMLIQAKQFLQRPQRLLMTGSLAILGLVNGFVPQLAPNSLQLDLSYTAAAQQNISARNIGQEQIEKFAEVLIDIEPLRQQALDDIKQIMKKKGENPPDILCHKPETYTSLPADASRIAQKYCNDSRSLVNKSGLTASEFNSIATAVRNDRKLKAKVQNAMRKVRREQ